MNYVDWGGWLKWLIHGPDHTTTEIECDAIARDVHFAKMRGGNARIIRCRARKAGEDRSTAAELYKPSCKSRREKVSVRKYDKRKEVANAKRQN